MKSRILISVASVGMLCGAGSEPARLAAREKAASAAHDTPARMNMRPSAGALAERLTTGKQVYEKWCAPCHADSPKLAGTLALQDKYEGAVPAALARRRDLTAEVIAYYVRNGVAWMAPFRKTEISDQELGALSTYLTTAPGKRP